MACGKNAAIASKIAPCTLLAPKGQDVIARCVSQIAQSVGGGCGNGSPERYRMYWIERLARMPGRVTIEDAVTVDIVQWAYAANLPDNVPHRHAYFEVCQVGSHGRGRFLVENSEHSIGPGTLFIARPGVIHQIRNSDPVNMELKWVAFQVAATEPRELPDLFRAFADAADMLTVADADSKVASLWNALRLVAEGPLTLGQDSQIASLISALLIAIAQAGAGDPEARYALESPHSAGSTLTRIAIHYVHDNLNRPLSVSEIAHQLNVSPRHMTRLFVEFAGVPPAAYIEQARMDRSRALLLGSDEPIKQIAALAGYSDVHHFTRVFTRRFGCAPGRYRQTTARRTKPGMARISKSWALWSKDAWAGFDREARTTVLVQMRDPLDPPTIRTHESSGQGMMLYGIDPSCRTVKPSSEAAAKIPAMGDAMSGGSTMGGTAMGGGTMGG